MSLKKSAMLAMALTACSLAPAAAQTAVKGPVGVVGPLATGMALACGGHYAPGLPGLFHATAPCGSVVQVGNPANGRVVTVQVIGAQTGFDAGLRAADITPATAEALGLNPQDETPPTLELRFRQGTGILLASPLSSSGADVRALALNMFHEADPAGKTCVSFMGEECTKLAGRNRLAALAVAVATVNRVAHRYRKAQSVHQVVYQRAQYSWTMERGLTSPTAAQLKALEAFAERYLAGRISGQLLAIRYMLGEADIYYAHRLIPEPSSWDIGEKYQQVWTPALPDANGTHVQHALDDVLGHRFYRPAKLPAPFGEPLVEADTRQPQYASWKELYAGRIAGAHTATNEAKGAKNTRQASAQAGKPARKTRAVQQAQAKPKAGKATHLAQANGGRGNRRGGTEASPGKRFLLATR